MHATARHGTHNLTSLQKDGGVSCFGRSSVRSPIQFLTVHSHTSVHHFYSTFQETSIGSSLLKEFCGGKVPTGIKQ